MRKSIKIAAVSLACVGGLLAPATAYAETPDLTGTVLGCVKYNVYHKENFGQKYSNIYYNNHCNKQVRLRVTYKFDDPSEPGPNTSCMLAVKANKKGDKTFDSRIISVDGNSTRKNCS